MLSVNKSQLPNSVTLNQKSDDVQNTNISAEPKEQITGTIIKIKVHKIAGKIKIHAAQF